MAQTAAARKTSPEDRAAAQMARHLNGEDQTVPQDVIDNLPKGATEDFIVAPPNAKDVTPTAEAGPEPQSAMAALEAVGERNKASQSAARKAAKPAAKPKAAPKAKAKVARAKAAPKPPVARVPAEKVETLLKELGMSKTQLAQAVGKSGSLVAEWTGKGRGRLMAEGQWAGVENAARAFAAKTK